MAKKKSTKKIGRKARENLKKMANKDLEKGRSKKQARKLGKKGRKIYNDAVIEAKTERSGK